MDSIQEYLQAQTRRSFFSRTGAGLGSVVFPSLFGAQAQAGASGVELPHFVPKAKRVIYLVMAGAPSQMDTFDYVPKMQEYYDKDIPDSVRTGQRLTGMTGKQKRLPIAPSIFNFKQYGDSGAWISELFPHISSIANDICIIKSMHTEAINHDPAMTYVQTGNQIPGSPSLGSWLSYGLGSPNKNLPSFVVMTASWTGKKDAQALYSRLWGSGFLPSKHQGVALQAKGDPVLYLSNPPGVDRPVRREMLDAVSRLNQLEFKQSGDPEIQTRIAQYEMAFRMQSSVPDLMDISKEPEYIFDQYGPDAKQKGTFAYSCLMARRMAESGVPFTQIFHRGWDQHSNLPKDLANQCRDVDQPCAALIKDLKERGLLEDTLVIWGGEFGRTIFSQGTLTRSNYGRDHHPRCFSIWMAGGGVKGGFVHGETDDFSYNVVKDPVHIHDLNATILHQLGIDNSSFSVKYQGLDQKLTSVYPAKVVKNILL
ncbi:MAG: DUF1501 domain-containing protein [Verrucomicrobia bacterium]|nr:DUF1501 domain-containing protein [Verrucomicrobiota bacterium]